MEDVEKNGFALTPGRYVGTDYVEEDMEVFDAKMKRLSGELSEQLKQSKKLEEKIKECLGNIGYKI